MLTCSSTILFSLVLLSIVSIAITSSDPTVCPTYKKICDCNGDDINNCHWCGTPGCLPNSGDPCLFPIANGSLTWAGTLLAKSNKCLIVEKNYYYPFEHVAVSYLRPSALHTTCPWKGLASYYDIVIGDKVYNNSAWTYYHPNRAAERIANYVAFYPPPLIDE